MQKPGPSSSARSRPVRRAGSKQPDVRAAGRPRRSSATIAQRPAGRVRATRGGRPPLSAPPPGAPAASASGHHRGAPPSPDPLERAERDGVGRASKSPLLVRRNAARCAPVPSALAEVVRQRPDVEASRAVDVERHGVRLARSTTSMDVDTVTDRRLSAPRQVRRSAARLRGVARAVAPPAVDLLGRKRRRLLQERAAERVERGFDRRPRDGIGPS